MGMKTCEGWSKGGGAGGRSMGSETGLAELIGHR